MGKKSRATGTWWVALDKGKHLNSQETGRTVSEMWGSGELWTSKSPGHGGRGISKGRGRPLTWPGPHYASPTFPLHPAMAPVSLSSPWWCHFQICSLRHTLPFLKNDVSLTYFQLSLKRYCVILNQFPVLLVWRENVKWRKLKYCDKWTMR